MNLLNFPKLWFFILIMTKSNLKKNNYDAIFSDVIVIMSPQTLTN